MGNKTVSVISYITWLGWVIAFIFKVNDRNVLQNINQGFILHAASTLSIVLTRIWYVGDTLYGVVSFAILVLAILGIYRAVTDSNEPLPVIGEFASPENSFFQSFTGRKL